MRALYATAQTLPILVTVVTVVYLVLVCLDAISVPSAKQGVDRLLKQGAYPVSCSCLTMENKTDLAFWFQHPSNIFIVGPTRSGKTHFLENALTFKQFSPSPERLVWVYAEWQPAYERLKQRTNWGLIAGLKSIEFVKDDTDYEEIYKSMNPNCRNMLVLDDQMTEAKCHADGLSNLFVKGSHHRNITIVLMLQNMFEKGMRTASLNTQYMVLLKNPRDRSQIGKLADQLMPNNRRFLVNAYDDATQLPHSHLVLDFQQNTPEVMRFWAMTQDKIARVYVPEGYSLS